MFASNAQWCNSIGFRPPKEFLVNVVGGYQGKLDPSSLEGLGFGMFASNCL